jgi:hypothetical protein
MRGNEEAGGAMADHAPRARHHILDPHPRKIDYRIRREEFARKISVLGIGWLKRKRSVSAWTSQGEMTGAALRSYFDLINPANDSEAATELEEVRQALDQSGQWSKEEEWRISTWMKCTIRPSMRAMGEHDYEVMVECDGQKLSCSCPSIERAFAFYRLYAHLIIYQFYSVGPPWAR